MSKIYPYLTASAAGLAGLLIEKYEAINLESNSNLPFAEPLNSYGWNFFAPVFMYNLLYMTTENKLTRAAITLGIMYAAEVSQLVGLYEKLGFGRITYDPRDFIWYTIGTIAAVGIEQLLEKKQF